MDNDEIFLSKCEEFDSKTSADVNKEEAPALEEKIDKRKGKSKRVLSDEQKAKLKENLAKGREKSLATRKRKAELRKIEKAERITEEETKVLSALEKKRDKSRANNDLLTQIAELKAKLLEKDKSLKTIKEVKEPEPKPKAKPVAPKVAEAPKIKPQVDPAILEKRKLMQMLKSLR